MKNIFFFLFIFSISAYSQEDYYPKFSWETVPIAFHFGKSDSLMTKEEAKFVTSKSNFIVLEKGHGLPSYKYTETTIEKEAKHLKEINPDMKVIFYWNAFLDYGMYKAHEVYQENPNWWLRKQDGELDFKSKGLQRYDLSNVEVRNWWTNVAKNEIVDGSTDGIFMDAFIQISDPNNINLWGQEKYDSVQQGLNDLIKETREKLGDNKLIVYNGIRSTPKRNVGNVFPDYTDVVMIEHFGHFASDSKESMLTDIQEMEKAGKSGKIVVFKAWPGFAWIDKDFMVKPYSEKIKISEDNITFPLAAFLVGAQEHSYFIYNWGYKMEMGCLEWYPEFDKPLGKPINDMVVNGYELTRIYEHASIWINLETNEAKINWK
ncbi:conserved hypothetical protein containing glycos ide hydrolase superfamily domain [Formosa agariphila KMM 3901]|uniref:Uncharacterized protein n=1 Tax=Formosa agariphila (strain DSM 15362 / KCTC 12365 / LMG 23005 / KMM 3901 / M-2Alg 35-1) TaxID=1347342 RepID=T2KME7_FORAG|nr:putative glycoside hydrolase family 15 protein [Formosa agariphila]CDF79633.1 conserved hypothetical protein containing glycos ide hydrolase superfamily domain [Formosa agariphila KMM 3901]